MRPCRRKPAAHFHIIIIIIITLYVCCKVIELDFICVFLNEYYHFHDHFQNVNSVNKIVNNVNSLSLLRYVEYPLNACKIILV